MRLKKINQIALKSAVATVTEVEVEIRVYLAFMNPSDDVKPYFSHSTSAIGL